MSIRNLARISAFLFLAACSSSSNVGGSCTSDDQCGAFKCLHDQMQNSDNTCSNVTVPAEGTCSPPCTTQADCMKYGATLKCALSQTDIACNPTGICLDDYNITCSPGPCRVAP